VKTYPEFERELMRDICRACSLPAHLLSPKEPIVNATEEPKIEIGWAVLELMGHRRLAGYIRPVELGGSVLLRIDVPKPETVSEAGPWAATQFYSPHAVYCITPCTMETAIRTAGVGKVEPVSRWELPAAPTVPFARGAADPGDLLDESHRDHD
jgi:hypothetical protein